MVSERKAEANWRNSKLSTGPKNTGKTRLNALKHGILSKEAVITDGEGKEEIEAFEELSSRLRRDLAPVGALEELLAEQVIIHAWRWRRVLRCETAAIAEESRNAFGPWGRVGISFEDAELFRWLLEEMKELLDALDKGQPLLSDSHIYHWLIKVCEGQTRVPISELLGSEWDGYYELSQDEVKRVIDATMQRVKISEAELWEEVEERFRQDYKDTERKMEGLERRLRLASLPDDKTLEKLQRYEAHISRQFYKSLQELQRLQAARLSSRPTAPLAVDINIGSAS